MDEINHRIKPATAFHCLNYSVIACRKQEKINQQLKMIWDMLSHSIGEISYCACKEEKTYAGICSFTHSRY